MSTGSQIKIDTAKMTAVAQAINNQMNIVKSCFDNIRKQSLGLRGSSWDGASADAYFDKMKTLCGEQPASTALSAGFIVGALEEYVFDLNKAAADYKATDREVESRVETLPTDIFSI